MRILIGALLFLFTLPALGAPRIESCSLRNSADPYIEGEWKYSQNGLDLSMAGGFQLCQVETQVRNFALEGCIANNGLVNGTNVTGGHTDAVSVDFYCSLWAEKSPISAEFRCSRCSGMISTDFGF